VESELNISMICGGGADAEQNFSESERTRSQKMKLRPPLVGCARICVRIILLIVYLSESV